MDTERPSPSKWLLALSVAVVLGYAWMSAHLMEPWLTFPAAIGPAVWYEAGSLRPMTSMSQTTSRFYREWARIFAQAKRLNQELKVFGKFAKPVTLIINTERPRIIAISEQRVELGREIAAADGQILKAMIKAWLYQSASSGVQSSQLRMEVASDVALGLIRGSYNLGLPNGEVLTLGPVDNWLRSAASFEASCASPWLPLEIANFCGSSERLNPLALRPLLTSILLESFNFTSPLDRMGLITQWLEGLRDSAKTEKTPLTLSEWRDWIRLEIQKFRPPATDGLTDALRRARLTPDAGLDVPFVLRMEDWRAGSDVATAKLFGAVLHAKTGRYSLQPSGLPVAPSDLRSVQAPISIRSGCESGSVLEILGEAIKTKWVLKLDCPKSGVEFAGLTSGGIGIFARENPQIAFLYLNRTGLELALRKSLLSASGSVDQLLTSGKDVSPLLGLDKAEWVRAMRAYRVNGAVEAIKWFRSSPAPKASLMDLPGARFIFELGLRWDRFKQKLARL